MSPDASSPWPGAASERSGGERRRQPAGRPAGLLARVLGMPAALYRARMGWLLGHRFLALSHRGRRTGRLHTTVLEVVRWRPEEGEAIVVSGFGRSAQWFRNVEAGGAEEVQIARLRFRPRVRVLGTDEAAAVIADYERRNRLIAPVVRAVLGRLTGVRYDGSPAARDALVRELPLVAFSPAGGAAPRPGAGVQAAD